MLATLLAESALTPASGVSIGLAILAAGALSGFAVARARDHDALKLLRADRTLDRADIDVLKGQVGGILTEREIDDRVEAKLEKLTDSCTSGESTTNGTKPYRKASR